MSALFLVVYIFNLVFNSEAARILAVFPTPSISHQVVFRPLMQELAKRGHDVVVITTDPAFPKDQTPENLTEIDVHDLSYKIWRENFLPVSSKGDNDLLAQLSVAFDLLTKLFKEQLLTNKVQAILKNKNKKIDLLITEALARPALALTHVLKIPLIQMSSFGAFIGNYETVGAPVHPFLYPTVLRQKIYNLTYWEKITELYNHYRYINWYSKLEATENAMVRDVFGEDVPSLTELANNVDMIFYNVNPIWEGVRPVPPNVIYMGGLHQKPIKELSKISELIDHYEYIYWLNTIEAGENEVVREIFGEDVPSLSELANNVDMMFLNVNPLWEGIRLVPPSVIYLGGLQQLPHTALPKDLKTYLDGSTNGVIYISFGTNVNPSQLPPEKIQILVKVFSQLPYNVLWKWDKDELPGRSANIQISKWLPQSDLLRHPNVKVFITQGGLQSTDEAITAGVPLIGIPMLGDQWFNVEKYTYHKIGKRLDIESLTEDQFRDAINTVIGDKSYRQNIIRLRTLMRDQPQPPLERAVWWTEYVIRHGGAKHLRSPAANISWAEYLELEFVGTLLALLLSVFVGALLLLYFVVKICKSFLVSGKVKTN